MLQRAASNAYSWWWASHVRTKQSKWLEQNLADMEEKVQSTLKLIEEEGDSFAKRAEMYYKSRPELIAFVQESYRSYRALAERYDHISTELQKANTALASVFPEQVQFSMEEEQEYNKLKEAMKVTQALQQNVPKAPPTGPVKQLRSMFSNAVKFQNKEKPNKKSHSNATKAHKSGLSKEDALAKIDKLQKEILVRQTEKEFFKSSYEHGVAKYNAIDKEINEMQEQVSSLQDEFGDGMFIEDEEARSLMSSAALKSCEEALAKLQEKQKMTKEAKVEHKRIKAIRKKLDALMKTSKSKSGDKKPGEARKRLKSKEQKVERIAEEHEKELEMLRAKIKEHFEDGEGSSLTVTEMAEKIDELVNKVISLESAVSSQAALIQKLRMETDGLQAQIQTVEGDKASGSKDLTNKLNEMEEKLEEIQDLDQSVQDQSNNLETHFTEARCDLDHLSEKLSIMKPDEVPEIIKVDGNKSNKSKKESKAKQDSSSVDKMESEEEVKFHDSLEDSADEEGASVEAEQNGEPNWRVLYMKGMGDRERNLLEEYTTVLRDYKELKKQHDEVEKKSQDGLLETLKAANATKDEEIRSLRQKLKHLQEMFNTKKDGGESESDTHSPKSLGKMMEENEDMKFDLEVSPIEEKFRSEIDALQEGNLDFWLRFSTSFHQIRKFETEFKDLKDDVSKLEAEKKSDINNARKCALKTEARSIYKHLREIETELNGWVEESALLKEELQRRFSSLCNIQEEITKALQDSAEDGEFKFTKFQAAKFEGELLNMKQENHKVVDELQAGLENVKGVQLQVEQCLAGLNDEFELTDVKENAQLQRSNSKNQIPLSSFLFGVKPKKQKQSFFSVVTHELNKKYIIK